MPVQVIVVVVAVVVAAVVVLLTGLRDIPEADLDHTSVLVTLANVIGPFIVHTPAVQCHLDDVMLETGKIPLLPDA